MSASKTLLATSAIMLASMDAFAAPATTTTALSSSVNPSVASESVTLTATVTPSLATGSVMFIEGSTTIGTANLSNGIATLSVTTLSIGAHPLTALYSGDSNYQSSMSALLTQTVNGIITNAPCSPNFTSMTGQASPAPIVCQFTAPVLTAFSVSVIGSWLQVSPSSGLLGPTATSLALAVNPAGLSAGHYTGSFTISGPQLGSSTILAQLTVSAGASGALVATPTSLSFNYQQGYPALPPQPLTVSSTNGSQLPFTVTASGGPWLDPGVNGGLSPLPFNVIVSPLALPPGTYTGKLTITSPGAPSISLDVTLTVTPPVPPQLSVNNSPVNLSGLQRGAPNSAQIQVSNAGGGVLDFTVSVSGGSWLSVSPASGTVDSTATSSTSGAPVSLTISADPSSLNPGTYQGSVIVTGAGTTASIPVTFSIASSTPSILVSQTGLTFMAVAQGGVPLPQQIGILNIGNGTLNWSATASTLSGGNWLQLSTPGGTVQRPYLDVSLAGVTIDQAVVTRLDPGDYYGQIHIADAAGIAINSPQLVTVILTILPPGADPGPEVVPSSLVFTGQAGISPDAQNVMVGIRKAVGDRYLSSHIGGAYTYSPTNSALQPNQPVRLQVIPDFTERAPGEFDRGTITLQFSDGTSRNISLLTVVAPAATPSSRLSPDADGNCSSLSLQWRMPSASPTPYFTVVQGRGQTLELQVVDSCGSLVGPANPKSASVQATFSSKDADVSLVHVGNGIWTGTWKPVNPSPAPVSVAVTAFNSNGQVLQSGQAGLVYGIVLPSDTPVVTAGGVQHAATRSQGAPIAPGSLIAMQGANLADADSATSGLPLPTLWNGTQVFLGMEPLPLLYAASGQVNVQVPFDVPINTQFQVTIQRDNLQSLPEKLVIAEAQPGIFTVDVTGMGQGIIFRSDGVTLAQPASCIAKDYPCAPATAGEAITLQCTGLGAVSPTVPAGLPPPASPVSTTVNPVSVTIGGLDAQATVGTLIPGRPGVYQVVATVPAGVSGDAVPVVVTVAGQISPSGVTMAVQ